MSNLVTRRQFLRSAGGVTFLALVPVGRGLFAAPVDSGPPLPRFTALPYIQPGNNSLLIDGQEGVTLAWQTELVNAEFRLDYGPTPHYGVSAKIDRKKLGAANASESGFNYAASLQTLKLDTRYYYRLTGNDRKIVEGQFTTRKPRGQAMRFVAFGDNANGAPGERAVAFQAYQAHPDFIMNTGDNVYDHGLNREYTERFFPVYNADRADPKIGGPILRSVPFYTVMANHDVNDHGPGHMPAADFDLHADSLAYYTNMHLPLNGPPAPQKKTPIIGAPNKVQDFLRAAGARFPTMANYSYDYGDAHFLCLDSNVYIDPNEPALQKWIADDLGGTDALWKFVVFHHPGFDAGDNHYNEQHMRALAPLLEAHGVDFCLNGHEHVYQRSRPLRFAPADAALASPVHGPNRMVPGDFTVDRVFDGRTKTRPDGILYIITGAGGQQLYNHGYDEAPEKWLHAEDNNVEYVARFVCSQHSLTIFDIDGKNLTMRQIGENGQELDAIRVTKA